MVPKTVALPVGDVRSSSTGRERRAPPDSLVLVRIKRRMAARGVPDQGVAMRLVTSTLVGELMDTLLFCTIAFAGTISLADLANYTLTGYVYKCLVEICVVPVTLLVIRYLKRVEPGYRPGQV